MKQEHAGWAEFNFVPVVKSRDDRLAGPGTSRRNALGMDAMERRAKGRQEVVYLGP